MAVLLILLFLLFITESCSFRIIPTSSHLRLFNKLELKEVQNDAVNTFSDDPLLDDIQNNGLKPPNFDDMRHLAFVLANVTDCLQHAPEDAITIASKQLGWFFTRDIPK